MKSSPFFIVGSQRSGTTMLRLMMDAHPELFVPFESDFLAVERKHSKQFESEQECRDTYNALVEEPLTKKGQFLDEHFDEALASSQNFAELFDGAMQLTAEKNGKQRWGIKTPGYHVWMDSLWRLFPGTKFIHIIRDGRAIAQSQRNIEWGQKNLIKLARKWNTDLRMASKMGAMIPDNYMEIRYEDLVQNPEAVLKEICQFIDVDYSQQMLEYHSASKSKMPSESMKWHKSSVSRPDPKKIDEWKSKLSKSDRKIFQGYAYFSLDKMGYEIENLPPSLITKFKELFYLFKS